MKMKFSPFATAVAFFLLISISPSSAQNNGRISGIVTDKASQQRLAFATVTLAGTNKTVITDSAGVFRITEIPLNTYTLEISLVGYKKQVKISILNKKLKKNFQNFFSFFFFSFSYGLSMLILTALKF